MTKRPGDDAARAAVFERDGFLCKRCGAPATDWCHVYSRGIGRSRQLPDNAWAGCRSCHEWFDADRRRGRDWWETLIGRDRMIILKSQALGGRNPALWGHKISAAIKSGATRHRRQSKCETCHKPIYSYNTQKYCSDQCRYQGRRDSKDDIWKKAVTSGSCLRLGKGKTEILRAMIGASIGKQCPYCAEIITLKSMQIDHKTPPIRGVGGRTPIGHVDDIDNLQVVCRRCNIAKGHLNDAAFRRLLAFLESDPEVKEVVWRKLGMSGHAWARFKK